MEPDIQYKEEITDVPIIDRFRQEGVTLVELE